MAIFAVGMVRMLLLICGMCVIVVHSYCVLSIPIKLYYNRNSLPGMPFDAERMEKGSTEYPY